MRTLHQNLDEIVKSADPIQKLLWNYIFLQFGDNIAVQQFVYRNILGDLGTYVAGQMFLAYQLTIGCNAGIFAAQPVATLNDEADANSMILSDTSAFFNAANQWSTNSIEYHNLLFSRITLANYSYVHCIGYRIHYT